MKKKWLRILSWVFLILFAIGLLGRVGCGEIKEADEQEDFRSSNVFEGIHIDYVEIPNTGEMMLCATQGYQTLTCDWGNRVPVPSIG